MLWQDIKVSEDHHLQGQYGGSKVLKLNLSAVKTSNLAPD